MRFRFRYPVLHELATKSAPIRRATGESAREVAASAKGLAPTRTGRYQRSIGANYQGVQPGYGDQGKPRHVWHVTATAPYSIVIESRSHTLIKAVEVAHPQ